MIARLEPIQKRFREITSEAGYIDQVLTTGRDRVLPIAADTVRKAKHAMGLYVSGI